MISNIANLGYELPHELWSHLRLWILGITEIYGKSRIWLETYSSAQSSFHDVNFGNSNQKIRKYIYKTFLFPSSFTGFLYLVPNILPRVVGSPFLPPANIRKSAVVWRFYGVRKEVIGKEWVKLILYTWKLEGLELRIYMLAFCCFFLWRDFFWKLH